MEEEMKRIRAYQSARRKEKELLAAIPCIRQEMQKINGKASYTLQNVIAGHLPALRMEEREEIDLAEFSFTQWVKFSRLALELPEDERADWEAARAEVSEILAPILEASYGLIVRARHRLGVRNRSLCDDLDAEGMIGVIRALERFDPESGNSFGAYSTYWITAMMLRGLEADQTVRIPEDARALRRRAGDLMEQKPGLTRWELAEILGVSEAKLDAAMASVQSMQAPVHSPDGAELGGMEEILTVDGEEDEITEYDRKILLDRLERIATELGPDLREAAMLRFPFADDPPDCSMERSLQEAVTLLKRQRVRQMEAIVREELLGGPLQAEERAV